ncbi:glycogen/starch synthase, partial [Faecalibacillus intestinalis]
FFPDVINLNDWHTGMIPLFLKENYSQDERYSEIKTIYTIHNLQYQGVFSNKNIEDVLSIPRHYLEDGNI